MKRSLVSLLITLVALVGWARPSEAEDAKLGVSARIEPARLGVGDRGLLRVDVEIPKGWHLWSMDPGPGPQALVMSLDAGAGLALVDGWFGLGPQLKFDRGFARELALYEQSSVRFERSVEAVTQQPSSLIVSGQICSDGRCMAQRVTVPIQLEVSALALNQPAPSSTLMPLAVAQAAALTVTPPVPRGPASVEAELAAARSRGLFSFVALAFVFGLGALATPCVFPAIPPHRFILLQVFGESVGRGARLALVYALTMVAAFTFLGVMLSVIFGVTGVQQFAAHPVFNLLLAAVLVFFSLNLLGLFEIQTPEFLLGAANRLESNLGQAAQGAGTRRRGGGSDYLAVAVAALTSTTVFFTCTVAFVGLVLVAAASGEWFWPTVGMLAFSSAFALPFFLLAMFPQAAKRLQGKAGGWLTATRVTLGFLELAAATKFLSNADLVWDWGLVTRQAVLVVWVPLFFLCGLFLLGKLRVGDESTAGPDGRTGVLQMLAAVVMFALALNLGVGLVQNKPFGGWLDGWLPPLQAATTDGPAGPALAWTHSLSEGRARAEREGKLVFVNYTGYTCTNCRYMEVGVFPDRRILPLLGQMVLVELYTDGGKPEHDLNRDDQVERFGTAALPLYSVEDAQGTVLASFPSSTNDVQEFQHFLEERSPRAGHAPRRLARGRRGAVFEHSGGGAADHPLEGWPSGSRRGGRPVVPRELLGNVVSAMSGGARGFMVATGAKLASHGGVFRTVAVESEDKLAEARSYMSRLGVPADAALRIEADSGETSVDPKLEWEDGELPFTFLVSPGGEVVWRHTGALNREQLHSVLSRFAGLSLVD